MAIFVQFADGTQQTVIASFSCPQDVAAWPNQGTLEDTDARYTAFVASLPKSLPPE